MTHDPLCPIEPNPLARECRTCDLIAKVRADTLDKARQSVAANEMDGEHFWCVGFRDGIAVALTEIDDLRGES